RCARGVLDALREHRAPIVVIDSGGGVVAGFATHRIRCGAGGELAALAGDDVASAVSECKKLAVVIVAEAGRGGRWAELGYLAGKMANDRHGAVSVQTIGANALATVRARGQLGLISLAEAMTPSEGPSVRVALGVDVLGILGWEGPSIPVAAAALPNRTTASADVILPLALPCELAGTFGQAGTRVVAVAALLPPPAGVPTPAELLGELAAAAGADVPAWTGKVPALDRLSVGAPARGADESVTGRAIVGARDPVHHSCGELTGSGSWQRQLRPLPELRLAPPDARELGVGDLDEVEVETESHRTRMRVRVAGAMTPGTLAFSAGHAEARR
ncbi:unnamed protein product, partial [marine sediment metagenome]